MPWPDELVAQPGEMGGWSTLSTEGRVRRLLVVFTLELIVCQPLPRPLPFARRCILFVSRLAARFSFGALGASSKRMATDDSGANHAESLQQGFLSRYVFNSNHKTIGLNYLWLALFSVFLGMAMSLLMRIHLVWPGVQLPFLSSLGDSPDRFAALTTLHGSLMVFLVLTAAPQAGFGNYFLPLQIGAREMAFPALNLLAFWATVASLLGLTTTFWIPSHPAITLWIVSVAIFCAASLLNALNFSVTTIDLRAQGMTLSRLPLTVWAWLINAILGLLIFSILLAACVCLLSDRLLSTHFFPVMNFIVTQPAGAIANAIPILWQRLFWFFAQAEVYVAMLPCFGLVTHLISTFSRKPVWKERLVVLALCGVGVFGFCVWGEHMFSSGMNPFSPLVFALLASSLGLPATILLISWLGTLWNARVKLNTAMLFALGFISLFLSGGLSGIFLARHDLAAAAMSDDFVTGHFHLVMGVAATFAILGALFFWFPKMFGRRLNEGLGKIHFWLTFAGVYCVFMPMHWLGLIAHTNLYSGSRRAAIAAIVSPLHTFITAAILLTVFAQGLFLINFLWSLFRGERVLECNPWRATTLEWSVSSPPPADGFGVNDPVVYRGAYEFSLPGVAEDFVPQHIAPEQVVKARQSGE
jgi:cytochrome c oxidase subunit 1